MMQGCIVDAAHSSPRHAFVKNGVDIYTCPTCGCIMADVDFIKHDQYEADSYYTMAFKDRAAIESEWGFRWRYILRALRRYSERPHLLDVGAGNGFFVFLAHTEFGLDADGLEISEVEAKYARDVFGVELLRGELGDLTTSYDVVSSFNVLEHVTEPQSLLTSMRERLSPDGFLILTTPSPGCIHRRLLGLDKWSMVCPPHHINLFTRVALLEMLARTGFEVLEYKTLSTYINYVRKFDTQGLLLRKMAFHVLKGTNLGADHFVVCRKRALNPPAVSKH